MGRGAGKFGATPGGLLPGGGCSLVSQNGDTLFPRRYGRVAELEVALAISLVLRNVGTPYARPVGFAFGRWIVNVAPWPGVDSTVMVPPCAVTIPYETERPRPVPRRV